MIETFVLIVLWQKSRALRPVLNATLALRDTVFENIKDPHEKTN